MRLTYDINKLREMLRYNPDTGEIRWSGSGDRFGSNDGRGYLRGRIGGISFYAHRVAFALHNGWWPEMVDHKDGDKSNNKAHNLVASDTSKNNKNSARRREGKPIGVSGSGNHWRAYIDQNNSRKWLGIYPTKEAAIEAVSKYRSTP